MFIIVDTDYLIKWVEIWLLPSKDAEYIAQLFFKEILMTPSCLIEILNENGTEFDNVLMDILAIWINVQYKTTSPYHPQCNGLRKDSMYTIGENGLYDDWWHEMLHIVIFICLISIHSSKGYSPFEVLYGRKSNLPPYTDHVRLDEMKLGNFDDYAYTFLQ